MAPEMLNSLAYNNKADLYSLGIALYEMLFGQVPFIGTDILDLIRNVKIHHLQFPNNVNSVSLSTKNLLRMLL